MNINYNTITQSFIEPEFDELCEEIEQITYIRYSSSQSLIFTSYSKGQRDNNIWKLDILSTNKEKLYICALTNLFRKLNFIELNQALETEDISEEYFDKELDENEEKYLIPCPQEKPTIQQIIQVVDIIKRLGKTIDLTISEVSEIFSLDMSNAETVLQANEKNLLYIK